MDTRKRKVKAVIHCEVAAADVRAGRLEPQSSEQEYNPWVGGWFCPGLPLTALGPSPRELTSLAILQVAALQGSESKIKR